MYKLARRMLLLVLALVLGSFVPRSAVAPCPIFFAGGVAPVDRSKDARQATLLCKSAYAVLGSWRTRDPVWSAEHLTAASVAAAHRLRRHGSFRPDPTLPPDHEAELRDYRRSGWDRGHMVPDGDMPTPAAQRESFDLANVVPQAPRLNRVTWAAIERSVRRLATVDGDAFVLTGPAFLGPPRGLGPDSVLIPSVTWKAVYVPSAHAGAAWICSNRTPTSCRELSIRRLEQQIRIELFPAVAPSWAASAAIRPGGRPDRS